MEYMKQVMKQFWQEDDGIGTMELLLILAVLIILAIAFRKWIIKWATELFTKADNEIAKTDLGGSIDKLSPPTSP